MKNGIDTKRLVLWSLYDFANSIVMIVFFLYYSQWLVVDRGVSDFWFNMTFVGPISWGLIVTYLPRAGAFNYRAAAVAMAVFVLIGLIFARKLPEPRVENQSYA